MENGPSDAADNAEPKSKGECKVEPQAEVSTPEPDNTAEIVGASIGGIFTIFAGVIGTAGHNKTSL